MKAKILHLLAASAIMGAAAQLNAADAAPKNAAPEAKQQKLVRVSTLSTIEANREFQTNVQLLQAQRQAAIELNAAHDKETDAAKKKDLKSRLDAVLARLNENNDKMRKTYGFSIDRNYTVVIETAHVYMFVTDEEAAKIEAAAKADSAKKK
ncbi:MAG: hypothetical protein RIR76_1916 [Verrucomicrobiota bacterium]|jgi:hypothetical protein|nr:hypothetical protein [Opitutaceae bacterium]